MYFSLKLNPLFNEILYSIRKRLPGQAATLMDVQPLPVLPPAFAQDAVLVKDMSPGYNSGYTDSLTYCKRHVVFFRPG